MEVTITLDKNKVMEEVYKITGYTGAKTDGEVMDKISSTEDDLRLLDSYYNEAVGSLSEIIANFGAVINSEVKLALPVNWDASAKNSVETNLANYLVNYVCVKWFNLTKKDDMAYYTELVSALSQSIITLLCKRTKPKR